MRWWPNHRRIMKYANIIIHRLNRVADFSGGVCVLFFFVDPLLRSEYMYDDDYDDDIPRGHEIIRDKYGANSVRLWCAHRARLNKLAPKVAKDEVEKRESDISATNENVSSIFFFFCCGFSVCPSTRDCCVNYIIERGGRCLESSVIYIYSIFYRFEL